MPLEALEAGLPWDWTQLRRLVRAARRADRRERRVPHRPLGGAPRGDGGGVPRAGVAGADRRDGRASCPRRAGPERWASPPRPRPPTTTPRASRCRHAGASRDELIALAAAVRDVAGHHPRGDPRRLHRGLHRRRARPARRHVGRRAAAAQLERARRVVDEPDRPRVAAGRVRPRRRARRPGGGPDAPALDAAAAVVPVRLRARRLPRLARGAVAAGARAHGGAVRPGGAPPPRRRRQLGGGGPAPRAGELAGPRGHRGVRAREPGLRGPHDRPDHRRARAATSTRSTCCSTSSWPTSSAPASDRPA